MSEDRISKDGTKAKCGVCGEWYGLDEAHGLYSSAAHVAAAMRIALERQIAAAGGDLDKTDLAAVREMLGSVERGAGHLEGATR